MILALYAEIIDSKRPRAEIVYTTISAHFVPRAPIAGIGIAHNGLVDQFGADLRAAIIESKQKARNTTVRLYYPTFE